MLLCSQIGFNYSSTDYSFYLGHTWQCPGLTSCFVLIDHFWLGLGGHIFGMAKVACKTNAYISYSLIICRVFHLFSLYDTIWNNEIMSETLVISVLKQKGGSSLSSSTYITFQKQISAKIHSYDNLRDPWAPHPPLCST